MPFNEDNLYDEEPMTKKKVALFIGAAIVIFAVTIGALMLFNGEKQNDVTKKPSSQQNVINNPSNATARQFGDVNLPIINQAELKQNYQINMTKIIVELEERSRI